MGHGRKPSFELFAKAAAVLAAMAVMIVSFGQGCGPAFKTVTEDQQSASSLSTYLTAQEKADCAASTPPSSNAFASLGDLLTYINSMPRPVKLHCLIAQLPRPLNVTLGVSASSAQPSPDYANPRIVIKKNGLLLAIVPDGPAKNTLEVGGLRPADMADRAEFLFPINEAQITEAAGLEHIRLNAGTMCGLCHQNEAGSVSPGTSPLFKSQVIRFKASERVGLVPLRAQAVNCLTVDSGSDRCLLLRSLFEGERLVESLY